jgi:hypothetical protein
MTETTTTSGPASVPRLHPADMLLQLIVFLLAPMFLCVSDGDIALARYAALETINAYRARNHAELIMIAQIVAFGLAALGSLSLSMLDDASLPTVLRLRGNANACNRSAEQNRRALVKSQANDAPSAEAAEFVPTAPEPDLSSEPEPFLSAAAEHLLAEESLARLQPAPTQDLPEAKHRQQIWATAMLQEVEDITATLASLRPEERHTAARNAETLNSAAEDLLTGPLVPKLDPSALVAMMRTQSGPQPPR